MLPSSEDVTAKYRQLLRLREEKMLKRGEIERIEAEKQHLEMVIKLAIGTAKGIVGIATWETGESRRRFNAETLKTVKPIRIGSGQSGGVTRRGAGGCPP